MNTGSLQAVMLTREDWDLLVHGCRVSGWPWGDEVTEIALCEVATLILGDHSHCASIPRLGMGYDREPYLNKMLGKLTLEQLAELWAGLAESDWDLTHGVVTPAPYGKMHRFVRDTELYRARHYGEEWTASVLATTLVTAARRFGDKANKVLAAELASILEIHRQNQAAAAAPA